MNDLSPFPAATGGSPPQDGSTTPAGLQSRRALDRARLLERAIGLWLLHGKGHGARDVARLRRAGDERGPADAAHRRVDDAAQRGSGARPSPG
jgi:hypothetical protein